MPHILDAQIPEVNPTGAPGGDFEQIRSSPAAFGGLGAQAAEKFGEGLTKAGTTGVDFATDLQSHVNDIHAAQLQTDYARKGTDLFTTFDGLQGQAKMLALPKFKEDLAKLRSDTLAGAPSLQEKTRLAPALAGLEDRYYYYATAGASHAQKQYATEVAADKKEMHGGQALLALSQGDFQEFYNEIGNAAQETRNEKEAAGLDEGSIETEAKKTRGVYVRQAIKLLLDQGDPHNIAGELAGKYKGLVDPASAVQIAGLLNAHRDQKLGDQVAQRAITRSGTAVGQAITQAASATGLPEAVLSRVVSIESGGNPRSQTGSYKGLFQLSDSEFNKYGGGDIYNPTDNAMAAARKLKAEAAEFQTAHGRPPTGADLYMIHNQGAAGYAAHLANPDAPAWQNMFSTGEGRAKGEAWAKAAIWGNVPDQDKARFGSVENLTSRQFVSLWQGKIGAQGAVSVGPSSLKSSAYQLAMSDPTLQENPAAMQHALTRINQAYTAAQVAADTDAKGKKEANDTAANGYVTRMLKGDMKGLVDEIAADPNLTWETRRSLGDAAEKHAGDDVDKNAQTYGKGFWGAYQGIVAPLGDEARISDVSQLLRRAGPGGDLTLDGVEKLQRVLQQNQKSVNDQAVNTSKVGLINYAKAQLSFEADTGPIKIRDPKGEAIFNAQFIPKFEAAYDKWQKDGKDPWQFLTRENVDKMLIGMRNKGEMAMDRMAATGEGTPEQPGAPLPPAPSGVDAGAWGKIVAAPPATEAGTPFPRTAWAQALGMLVKSPTEETMKLFDQSKFGRAGYRAQELIKQLTPAAKPQAGSAAPQLVPEMVMPF